MSKRKIIAIAVCAVLIATALLLQLDFSKIKISTKSGSPGTVSGLDDLGGALEFAYMRNLLTSELVGGKMTEKEIVQAAEEIKRDCMTAEISIGSSSAYEYTVRTKETQGENSSSGGGLGDILGGLGGLGDLGGLGGLGNILGSLTGTKVTIVTTTQLLSADIRLKCAFGESRTYYDIDAALSSNSECSHAGPWPLQSRQYGRIGAPPLIADEQPAALPTYILSPNSWLSSLI